VLQIRILGFLDLWIRDPGWKIVGSRISDKHPGSATLLIPICIILYVSDRLNSDGLIQIGTDTIGFRPEKFLNYMFS